MKKEKRKLTREEFEKKKRKIKKILILLAIIIVLAIIFMVASNFIILDKNNTTNLVINNKNVTLNLKNEIIVQDDIIYLSQQDLANFFDKYIYKEEATNQIITTYNKKIAAIGYDKDEITINGANKNIYAHAIEENGITYLPISEMKDVYGIEIEYIDETKVLTIDSTDKEQKKAILSSSVAVKSSKKLIAKTIDRVEKGESVVVISRENGYARIRTQNGKIGYVKEKKLINEFTVRENMEEEKQIEGKVNLTWEYFSEVSSAPSDIEPMEGVNVVSPAFFYLDEEGNFKENVESAGEEYIEWAHNNNYKVWPMVSNALAGISKTSEIMNSYEKRQELIEDIVNACIKYKVDGINIDFENMKQEDKDLYSRFIIELTPRIKEIGLVISVDVTAPDGGETWSMCFDRNVIGDVADYIIFMAYDEYGETSKNPGTTAGYNWVQISLNKFLTTEDIKSEKIILAVPFYTRIWTTTTAGTTTSNAVSIKNIENVIPSNSSKTWDDDLKQYYVEYNQGSNIKQIWVEDLASLKEKLSLITSNNLAGVASWARGMETKEVWSLIVEQLEL